MNKEYTPEEMLQRLETHFKNLGYKVECYSKKFLPARVPLHCEKEYLFRWEEVPGKDSGKFIEFLKQKYGIDWIKEENIKKSDDKTIKVSNENKSLSLSLNDEKTKVNLKIDEGSSAKFIAKSENGKLNIYEDKTDEIIVEITTDRVISKDDFFPLLEIDNVEIPEASPVRFYQYYFPKAKIYYAYPDNVKENTGFDDFRKVCEKRGIGLLKISETVEVLLESCPLFNTICNKLIEDKIKPEEIKNVISDLLDSYLHFLVYYPEPVYRRSEIMERGIPKQTEYLFSWDKIPGNDNGRLIKYLKQKFGIEWIKTANIEKIDDGRTIRVFDEKNSLSLSLNDEKTKVNLKIDDRRADEFDAKKENSKLSIYLTDKLSYRRIPYKLTDKLNDLKKISYSAELKQFAPEYRQTIEDDYTIAELYISNLWDKYLGLTYPNIQNRVENILQRNEKYREHFVHQFQVFLIGAYILDILDQIYPEVAENFEKEHGGCKIENVWLAASTFHDFNYGLQNFDTWLMEFFEETLWVKCSQTKENLNLLNLDAAMIREALYENLTKIIDQLKRDWEKDQKENLTRFFYEKAVRDRNHGVLSAISLMKLYEKSDMDKRKIDENSILEAAVAIGCHDEDIWEALCGCKGYRKSSMSPPATKKECGGDCKRQLWSIKKSKIIREQLSKEDPPKDLEDKCEDWERHLMEKELMKNLRFEDYPILFLLIFCDSVQDEGRVTHSDEMISNDRSSLNDIKIETINGKTYINVMIQASKPRPKEEEIYRLRWCLFDEILRISINGRLIKLDFEG